MGQLPPASETAAAAGQTFSCHLWLAVGTSAVAAVRLIHQPAEHEPPPLLERVSAGGPHYGFNAGCWEAGAQHTQAASAELTLLPYVAPRNLL